ncbi:hypothetical protein AGOR_G00082310 [Albula goreensis]|uniref:Uncharacterized protein n=1 Tax=Albula goreensis TaxID=1534307 RepID=A0A8T3DMG3_9TELE|nr:hypothetical protein AGOR_G00082310 [Albula goreensis]
MRRRQRSRARLGCQLRIPSTRNTTHMHTGIQTNTHTCTQSSPTLMKTQVMHTLGAHTYIYNPLGLKMRAPCTLSVSHMTLGEETLCPSLGLPHLFLFSQICSLYVYGLYNMHIIYESGMIPRPLTRPSMSVCIC